MYHILVVDDDPPIREWMKLCILRNFAQKVQVDCAANGAEALRLFEAQRHDIVITDIVMPSMDGLDLLARLQKLRQDYCSVMLSSHSKFEYVRTAMKLNSSEYILKQEMDETHLVEVVNRCLARLDARSRQSASLLNRDSFLALLTSQGDGAAQTSPQALAEAGITLSEAPVLSFVIFRKYHRPARFVMPSTAGENFSLYNVNSYAKADNYSILFCNVSTGGRAVREILNEVQLINPACTILEGALVSGPGELGRCLKEAQDVAPLGFYLPGGMIERFTYRQVLAQRAAAGERMRALQEELYKTGLAGMPAALADYFALSAQGCPQDVYAYKRQCARILRRIALLAGSPAQDVEAQEQELMGAFSLEECRAVLERAATAPPLPGPEREHSPHIVQALAYLHQNYAAISGMNEVAAHVHVSPEHFSRLFKAETGRTFISYLNDYRLAQAKRLLDETSLKVFQVAEQVGYASLSYFSKLFKDAYGINPFGYRSQAGEKGMDREEWP